MKIGRFAVLFSVLLALFVVSLPIWAEPVTQQMAGLAADSRLWVERQFPPKGLEDVVFSISKVSELHDKEPDGLLGYVFELSPWGYIVVSPETKIRPIIAYSYTSVFSWKEVPENILLDMLRVDMGYRIKALEEGCYEKEVIKRNSDLWDIYLGKEPGVKPPVATSTWGPLLNTSWDQCKNWECPTYSGCDGCCTSGTHRCCTGCVATAMGQIINYWMYPSSVTFTSTDSYYTDKRHIWVNAPPASMSSINYVVGAGGHGGDPSNQTIADLLFAVGVSIEMDYCCSSDGKCESGAWHSYAACAFHGKAGCSVPERWGYDSADHRSYGSSFLNELKSNMQSSRPAMLGIHKTGEEGGHSVVCDGYKDTGEYHINYGWDGTCNGWYSLPYGISTGCPYADYNAIHDGVMNIYPPIGAPKIEYYSKTIDDDTSGNSNGNDNGKAEPGETIELYVTLKNNGDATAHNVSATLSTSDPKIDILYNTSASFGDIAPGATKSHSNDFDLKIDSSHSTGSVAFSLSISYDEGSDTASFSLYIYGTPDIVYHSSTIDDDENTGQSHGDGDGKAEAGETIELIVRLKNNGSATAHNVKATLSTSDSKVSIWDNDVPFGNIAPGATAMPSDDYDFDIDCSHGASSVTFNLNISYDEGSDTGSFSIYIYTDTTKPSPSTMTWSTKPHATSSSAAMVATTATDLCEVEYYFDFYSGGSGGTDSGWQDSPSYTDSGLSAGTKYCYRVRARDKSPNQNTTGWSSTECTYTGTSAKFRVTKEGDVLTDQSYHGSGFHSGGADIAEYINASEAVEPGDVVELDPEHPGYYRKSCGRYSTLVAGVISTAPGMTMGQLLESPATMPLPIPQTALNNLYLASMMTAEQPSLISLSDSIADNPPSSPLTFNISVSQLLNYPPALMGAESKPLLALMGVVPVKTTTENGSIKPGDLLTTSSTPGHAMRCIEPKECEGAIIGKALEPLEEGTGVIGMLVMR